MSNERFILVGKLLVKLLYLIACIVSLLPLSHSKDRIDNSSGIDAEMDEPGFGVKGIHHPISLLSIGSIFSVSVLKELLEEA